MKIAFSTRAMDVYPHRYGAPLPPDVRERVLRWGAARGFEGVEIEDRWALVEEMDEAELDRFRDQAASAGIALTLKLHFRDLATPQIAAQSEAGVLRNVEAAARLGAPQAQHAAPRRGGSRQWGRDAAR